MIFGSYPCCDADLAIPVPERTPAYRRELCPSCGAAVWHVLSRLDPVSYVESEFLDLYEVDEAAGIVTAKAPPEPEIQLTDAQRAVLARLVEDCVLYGESRIERPAGLIPTMKKAR